MPADDDEQGQPQNEESAFGRTVATKERRKERARRGKDTILFGLGMFGLVGWSVAIPTLAGIALGAWIDSRVNTPYSWTLTLMFVGVVLGCLNAWYWVKLYSRAPD